VATKTNIEKALSEIVKLKHRNMDTWLKIWTIDARKYQLDASFVVSWCFELKGTLLYKQNGKGIETAFRKFE
jgi:hypothetical protein